MDSATPLARNLKQLRTERQWTFEDAAVATGFDAEVLEGLERGSTFLSRTRLADLAERLGVRLDDLVN
ncbi:MAG TPA: helix-turn-helix transcriptional regulator [Acidimicrobiales bacterium]|jgi:transcriptional regulator with XRE-family HTH domain|nr:helix-turn-helix transcriptional regulator [Acidimicrobiales bacterium]